MLGHKKDCVFSIQQLYLCKIVYKKKKNSLQPIYQRKAKSYVKNSSLVFLPTAITFLMSKIPIKGSYNG